MRSVLVSACLGMLLAGCTAGAPRGMSVVAPRISPDDEALVELARAEPAEGERVVLAVYPRDPCTGSASAVIVDESGRFLGSVSPGGAALLRIPRAGRVLAFSSIDVTASEQAEPLVQEIDPQSLTGEDDGLVFRTLRGRTIRSCGNGQYMEALRASKGELEAAMAEKEYVFLEPNFVTGQAWLAAHRARFARILGLAPAPAWVAQSRARVVYR